MAKVIGTVKTDFFLLQRAKFDLFLIELEKVETALKNRDYEGAVSASKRMKEVSDIDVMELSKIDVIHS